MAQKYNPSTGQWEDEEEDNGTLSGGLSTVFGGSSPEMDGSAMTAGIPVFSNGSFSNPQYSLSNLPQEYSWGNDDYYTAQGITKKYANPWDTKYSYMKGDQDLGFGYDDYSTAIKKLAFNSGTSYQNPTEATSGWGEGGGFNTPGTPGGYRHSAYSVDAGEGAPATLGQLFDSKQALWDFMNSDPTGKDALSYDSREKYGRKLTEGQLQNMYSQYASGNLSGAVPDWTYHRAAYPGVGGGSVSGDAAMVGSTPFFGPDGKLLGYKSTLNPEHIRGADTSGRVRSSTWGATNYSPEVEQLLRRVDDNTAFISAADKDKYGYSSSSANSYSKADSSFSNFLKKAAPIALAAFLGPQMFGPAAGAAGAGEAALAGGLDVGALLGESVGMGFSPAAGLSFSPASSLGSLAEIGAGFGGAGLSSGLGAFEGLGGLGLEGLPGMVSDLGSLFGETIGQGFTPSSGLEFSPTSSIGSTGIGAGQGGLGFASELGVNMDLGSVFAPAAEALSPTPEYQVPDSYSPLDGVDPFETTDMVNKGWNRATGYGLDNMYGKNAFGIPQGTAQEIKNMYNFMTQPMGGQRPGLFQAPSPLNTLFRGISALDSVKQNKSAMDMYKKQLSLAQAGADPNRVRGNFANEAWQQNFQDPMAGYKDFMMGGGRDFIDQARAQAAKSGKRGSYINSGKMNSDLASMYMKQQLARGQGLAQGFERPDSTQTQLMRSMGPLMSMEKNKYSPLYQVAGDFASDNNLSSLFDTVKGWF